MPISISPSWTRRKWPMAVVSPGCLTASWSNRIYCSLSEWCSEIFRSKVEVRCRYQDRQNRSYPSYLRCFSHEIFVFHLFDRYDSTCSLRGSRLQSLFLWFSSGCQACFFWNSLGFGNCFFGFSLRFYACFLSIDWDFKLVSVRQFGISSLFLGCSLGFIAYLLDTVWDFLGIIFNFRSVS